MRRMSTARIFLLSAAVLSAAVALRLSAPAISEFLFFEVPRIYRAALIWLTPPYLYVVINGIIISIAASSRFHKEGTEPGPVEAAGAGLGGGSVVAAAHGGTRPEPPPAAVEFQIGDEAEVEGSRGVKSGGGSPALAEGVVLRDGDEEDFVISRSNWTPKSRRVLREIEPPVEFERPAAEKPLVSERFGGRRSIKASPEGRPLGVARPKKNETLENTWKTITDGRAMPLTRHLRKAETWGTEGRGKEAAGTPPMRKYETFNEPRGATPSPLASPARSGGSGRMIRREPSPGQDELNRRVEAFIKKFNEEMRLQRQNSFKHYMEMINRAGQQ